MSPSTDLSRDESKSLQESFETPPEALHDQVLATPPSHFTHRKAEGVRLIGSRSKLEIRWLMDALT